MLRLLNFWNRKSQVTRRARSHGHSHGGPRRLRGECLERRDMLSGTPPTVVEVQVASSQWTESFLDYLETSGRGVGGYTIPTGSAAQTATLPWTGLDLIKIRFSEDVHVDAADLSLSGVNTTAYTFSEFYYDPQARLATWTLSAPLEKDRLWIDLDGDGIDPVRDLNGNLLDGEWINGSSTYASGDGVAGGDFEFLWNVLPGDVNNSSTVRLNDYMAVGESLGMTTLDAGYVVARDIDGNGIIDQADRDAVYARMFSNLPNANPAGMSNDAPTTAGPSPIAITDETADAVVALTPWFDDAESGAGGLSYSIVANSRADLFDYAMIDGATKSLVVNTAAGASGRAELTIRATDEGGLHVDSNVIVDVNYENVAPGLEVIQTYVGGGTWIISGNVIDPDDDLSAFIVEFHGAIEERTAVDRNGRYEFATALNEDEWGNVTGWTFDAWGAKSNEVKFLIGLT